MGKNRLKRLTWGKLGCDGFKFTQIQIEYEDSNSVEEAIKAGEIIKRAEEEANDDDDVVILEVKSGKKDDGAQSKEGDQKKDIVVSHTIEEGLNVYCKVFWVSLLTDFGIYRPVDFCLHSLL